MRPIDLSEFSYGYALTESLTKDAPFGVTAAPLFPSLKKEGQPGGGYDLQLNFNGFLLFLQFKLTDRMQRRSALEVKKGVLEPPFFRMHLRSSAHSDQHQLLLDLEAAGNTVYYAAPKFTLALDLDDAYLNHQVVQRSVFISPQNIGPLPDNKEHWIAFAPNSSNGYFLSKKPRLLEPGSLKAGAEFIASLAQAVPKQVMTAPKFESLALKMQETIMADLARRRPRRRPSRRPTAAEEAFVQQESQLRHQFDRLRKERRPDEAVGYLARTFFGAEALRVEAHKEQLKKSE